MTPRGLTAEDRFWMKTVIRETDQCWTWVGAMSGKYGKLFIERDWAGRTVTQYAHRFSYELHYGPIPAGMEVDHTCVNSDCVNPAHLSLTTPFENKVLEGARQQYCLREGHPFTPENTYVDGRGHRRCRACAQQRRWAA